MLPLARGPLTDRSLERLGKSDQGIVFLRRIFWREMDALASDQPTKAWKRLTDQVNKPLQTQAALHNE